MKQRVRGRNYLELVQFLLTTYPRMETLERKYEQLVGCQQGPKKKGEYSQKPWKLTDCHSEFNSEKHFITKILHGILPEIRLNVWIFFEDNSTKDLDLLRS